MIGFSVFLCKEKIAIIKRKREKGHVDLSSSTFEGKKKTENGTKRLIFTAVSILLEIVFLLFLFTKVSEYATIIDWATRIVAIFLVLGLYSMDKTSSMKMPWIILMLAFPILGVSLYLLVGLNGSTKKMRARYEEMLRTLGPEFYILREAPLAQVEQTAGPAVAEGIRRLREGARIDAEPGEGVEQDRRRNRATDQSGHGAVIGPADPDADRVLAVEADGPGVTIAV